VTRLRTAVVGVGYLGRFHAQKYAALPDVELVAVADVDAAAAAGVAEECGCTAHSDYRELLGAVDAVSIVVPTTLHHEVASAFLGAGAHVLLEKPMTTTLQEADALIELAARHRRVLQVGHLERFNAALLELDRHSGRPLFIESHRLAPFKPRATDVSVVLDLMIHDIDIILNLVGSEVSAIAASGACVLSDAIDIANARLEFENGCVANVTSSRISMKSERKMRLFQADRYISVDFQNKELKIFHKGEGEMFPGVPDIVSEESSFAESDALRAEIEDFIDCVHSGRRPRVDGADGRRALQTAMRITELVQDAPAFRQSSSDANEGDPA
jgi:predicted dehydrogenase